MNGVLGRVRHFLLGEHGAFIFKESVDKYRRSSLDTRQTSKGQSRIPIRLFFYNYNNENTCLLAFSYWSRMDVIFLPITATNCRKKFSECLVLTADLYTHSLEPSIVGRLNDLGCSQKIGEF
jgi:hypothetical protein